MSQSPDQWIDQVRDATDIVEVVGRYTALKRKGRHFWGLCPFHSEKTPSFSVDPDQQLFYCFGCHAGGTVFTFLMRLEGKEFRDVVQSLADDAGIVRPHVESLSPADRHRSRLLAVCEWSLEYFIKGRSYDGFSQYLDKRNVAQSSQERFQMGYAPNQWNGLSDYLKTRGVSPDEMEQAGVVVRSQDGARIYDRWRHRIIFPIWDDKGRLVGFGGRSVDDDQNPKYLNSPDTELFHKGSILYASHLARAEWRKGKRPLLVEGYFDVIACHEAGMTQAVASLGTALTEMHARFLARYHKEVDLLYDFDTAGVEATKRSFQILSQAGLRVNRVMLEDGKDPDEFRKIHGNVELVERVNRRIPYFEWLLNEGFKRSNVGQPRGKAELIEELRPTWSMLSDPIEKASYLEVMANKLHINQTILTQSFDNSQGPKHTSGKIRHNIKRESLTNLRLPSAEVELLALIMKSPGVIQRVENALPEWVQDPSIASVLDVIQTQPTSAVGQWLEAVNDDVRPLIYEALSYEGPDVKDSNLDDYIRAITRQQYEARWKELIEKVRRGETNHDVMQEYKAVELQIRKMKMGGEG